jgi:serine/threonine protein kinase
MISKMDVPEHWPPEVKDQYEPISVLGKGGFASVVLAKVKNKATKRYVAIKVVGGSKMSLDYAHRELEVLAHVSHHNIMKVEDSWERPDHPAVMALTYYQGPTLDKLLRWVGAPSLVFGRIVSAQLVDVVSYLHSHAVMHRDIKPDNLIITGATVDDIVNESTETFETLRKKWHLTLVDFGFARALGPDDIQISGSSINLSNRMVTGPSAKSNMKPGGVFIATTPPEPQSSQTITPTPSSWNNSSNTSQSRGRGGRARRFDPDQSLSKCVVRQLSPLGHRDYAAPEILKGITANPTHEHALSDFCSDYGMVADAYSVGSTIRYMMTGVSPDQSVTDVIAADRSLGTKASRWLGRKLGGRSKEQKKLRKKYRGSEELPTEVVRLVKSMTHADPKQRTTVRAARLYPWIDDALPDSATVPMGKDIRFLPIVMPVGVK